MFYRQFRYSQSSEKGVAIIRIGSLHVCDKTFEIAFVLYQWFICCLAAASFLLRFDSVLLRSQMDFSGSIISSF